MDFTYEELQLIAIYKADSLPATIAALHNMRGYLEPDEIVLLRLTDSALAKLGQMDEAAFDELDLIPDASEN